MWHNYNYANTLINQRILPNMGIIPTNQNGSLTYSFLDKSGTLKSLIHCHQNFWINTLPWTKARTGMKIYPNAVCYPKLGNVSQTVKEQQTIKETIKTA